MSDPPPRYTEIDDLCQMRLVSDPQVSPDGRWAACVVTMADAQNNTYRSSIWLVDLHSRMVTRHTNGLQRDVHPRWAPNGTTLAFISDRNGCDQVWLISVSGGEASQLTNTGEAIREFAWSPSGDEIAFVCKSPRVQLNQEESPALVVNRLRYRINGQGVLDDRRQHVWIMASAGSTPIQLTDGDWNDSQIVWRPDGKAIAFLSNRTEHRDRNNVADIWLVSREGKEVEKLTMSRGHITAFSWSPDGSEIAFVGDEEPFGLAAYESLWLLDLGSQKVRNLTNALDRNVGAIAITASAQAPKQKPIWDPDGRAIYCLVGDSGNTHIYKVGSQSGVTCEVGGERICIAFAITGDGRAVFVATTPSTPTELYVSTINDDREEPLTALNAELLGQLSVAATERLTIPCTWGQLDAWFVRPVHEAERPPLILVVHGGPLAFFGNGFMFDEQILAAQGYAVLMVNPRGSTGYGEQFATCLRGDLGGMDYDDLMRAVDSVVDNHNVDPERLAVMGGSYGGYMTNRILSLTNRFRAGVSEKSISNFVSLYGTTDTTFLDCEWYFLGMPHERMDLYIDRSPISRLDNITTPLLIIHGENDLMCPIEQAEQLFIGLKRLGRDVSFVRYQGEDHGLNSTGHPRARLDRLHRLAAWFKAHLEVVSTQA
jgi:dipeptidyl aminopeptidase/acylaminoacyl peptidase